MRRRRRRRLIGALRRDVEVHAGRTSEVRTVIENENSFVPLSIHFQRLIAFSEFRQTDRRVSSMSHLPRALEVVLHQ